MTLLSSYATLFTLCFLSLSTRIALTATVSQILLDEEKFQNIDNTNTDRKYNDSLVNYSEPVPSPVNLQSHRIRCHRKRNFHIQEPVRPRRSRHLPFRSPHRHRYYPNNAHFTQNNPRKHLHRYRSFNYDRNYQDSLANSRRRGRSGYHSVVHHNRRNFQQAPHINSSNKFPVATNNHYRHYDSSFRNDSQHGAGVSSFQNPHSMHNTNGHQNFANSEQSRPETRRQHHGRSYAATEHQQRIGTAAESKRDHRRFRAPISSYRKIGIEEESAPDGESMETGDTVIYQANAIISPDTRRETPVDSKRNSSADTGRNSPADTKRNSPADTRRNSPADTRRNSPASTRRNSALDARRTSSVKHNSEDAVGEAVTTAHDESDEEDHKSSLIGADALRVGRAINVFSRYGFLTLSVKVFSGVGGQEDFLFRENTAEVFQKNSYWGKRETRRHSGSYDDHFYIHFCENVNELLIAYFDHFTLEGVPKAHKAFTSSLSSTALARQFGVNPSFLTGHFSFVLVRLFRRRRRSTLKGPLEMAAPVKHALQGVRVGSTESVHQFVDSYGSHIITEFEVGDMMYQAFVFGERLYKQIKNKFAVVSSNDHLEELQRYFTPNYAANVGNVLLASGNPGLHLILESGATTPERLLYPNIFRVFEIPGMEAELEQLEGEVVLSLKLDKITSHLPASAETRWMSEVLDNTLAVYYQQMSAIRNNA